MSKKAKQQRTPARKEQTVAWELRGYWAKRQRVVVTLSKRCIVDRVDGYVDHVSVTGAFAVIDGWHVPCVDVLGIATPHFSQVSNDPCHAVAG